MAGPQAAATSIPDAVRASVLQRVKQLGRRDRSVLFYASVIGRRFDVRLLTATISRAPAEVRGALERACMLQLLEDEDGQGERFIFRHALTRDVAYGELLATRTRPLHRRIARALETQQAGAIEDVAYHWWAAGDRRRGVRANEAAGDDAAALHAAGVALVHYRRALALADLDSTAYTRLNEKVRSIAEDA